MFVRLKRSVHNGATYEYLQIVRSYREAPKVRQQVLATLGRRETVVAAGELDALLRSLARFRGRVRSADRFDDSGGAALPATDGPVRDGQPSLHRRRRPPAFSRDRPRGPALTRPVPVVPSPNGPRSGPYSFRFDG